MHDDLRRLLEHQLELAQFLHSCGSLAPLAATLNDNGEVVSETFAGDRAQRATAEDAVRHFEGKFHRDRATIRASVVLFHAAVDGRAVRVARSADDARALVAWLRHSSGISEQVVIEYSVHVAKRSDIAEIHYGDPQCSDLPPTSLRN